METNAEFLNKTFKLHELAYFTLHLLDEATLYSKEKVLKAYEINKNNKNLEEILFNNSTYPDGEKLGFYNISKYTLSDLDIDKDLDKLDEQFSEYFEGFNEKIKELFNLIPDIQNQLTSMLKNNKHIITFSNRYDSEESAYITILRNMKNEVKNKANSKDNVINLINDFLKDSLEFDDKYINYEDMSDLMINVLFKDMKFKNKKSILHIQPESPFIFSCFEYIKNENPKCDIELFTITNDHFMNFALFLLSIAFGNINFFSYYYHDYEENIYDHYTKFFQNRSQFDFIIQPNLLSVGSNHFDMRDFLSHYNIKVSSRIIYINDFGTVSLNEEWLKKDLLESLILIPYKNTSSSETNIFKYSILTIINYQKLNKRKNKFLLIDKNHNQDINSFNYSLNDYRNLVKSDKIYENSFKAFSHFNNTKYSKLISINSYMKKINKRPHILEFDGGISSIINHIDNIINEDDNEINIIKFDFNEEMYDTKMGSQMEYLKKEYMANNNRIIQNLNFPQEKLINLIRTEIETKNGDFIVYDKKSLNFRHDIKEAEKIAFLNTEISNDSEYTEFRLISDKVSLKYLYYYLNSEMGRNEYNYFFRGHERFNTNVYNIRVPIPPQKEQKEIVEAMEKTDDFFNEINQLKTNINKNFFDDERNINAINEFFGRREYSEETANILTSESWLYTFSGLVWPLAISYLIATSGNFENTAKANNLLRLFEFTSAFNAYVLISGIPENVYKPKKNKLWNKFYDKTNNDEKFVEEYKLTFGSWIFLHNALSDIYKKKQFNTEINKEFYFKLIHKNIRNLYEKTKDLRNNEFHNGNVSDEDAKDFIEELNNPKKEIFKYLNSCYENFKLYYNIQSSNVKKDNKIFYEHNVMYLNGPYAIPIYTKIESDDPLEPETLYIQDVQNNKFAKLDDRLIKFKGNNRDWRLYVFLGVKTDGDGTKKAIYRNYLRSNDTIEEDIDQIYDFL